MKTLVPTIKVDCINDNCPIPLVKTREAIMKAKKNDIIEVIGTHPNSYDEIPMALNSFGLKILERTKHDGSWQIIFKV